MGDRGRIFERLVEDENDDIHGFVAYGIYKRAKREWVSQFETENGRLPEAKEVDAYVSSWTPQVIQNAQDAASSALAAYADEAIVQAKPGIVEEALKGTWIKSVLQSMLAAVLYTIALLAVAVTLKAAGIDLLGIVGAVH